MIFICYFENLECCIFKGVDVIFCYCLDILNIVVEVMFCDGDSYYVEFDLVVFDFGDIFIFEVDGVFYGFYIFLELLLIIGLFEGNGVFLYLFVYLDG